MRLLFYVLLFLTYGICNAKAQTFATDSGIADTAVPNEEASSPSVTAEEAPSKASDAPKQRQNELMEDADVNIGEARKKETEKKYDNSVGRIIEYKIVDGDIVFKNDDDRKVLIYYENYKVEKGMDNLVRCSMRIYVLNDLTERINNLSFKLIWPEISTSLQMARINPGVRTYQDIMLLGNGCFSMDKTPTLEINRCRVKGKTEEQCANTVKWFKNSK